MARNSGYKGTSSLSGGNTGSRNNTTASRPQTGGKKSGSTNRGTEAKITFSVKK